MSDFFTIELDTTAPGIEISMPAYTGRENWNEIVIQSDEVLDAKQEFYFVDSSGNSNAITFLQEETRFLGEIRFNDYPNGIATLVATVWDEVGNPSAVAEKSINILGNSLAGTADLQVHNRIVKTEIAGRSHTLSSRSRAEEIYTGTRDSHLQTRTRTGGIAIE